MDSAPTAVSGEDETTDDKWARSCENVSYAICEQQRRRSAAYPCSLISSFVVHCLDSIISLDSKSEISSL